VHVLPGGAYNRAKEEAALPSQGGLNRGSRYLRLVSMELIVLRRREYYSNAGAARFI